jgi:hypothetical protein
VVNEPVDKLSEVLSNLQDLHDSGSANEIKRSMLTQIEVLRDVQLEMQTQLKLHDSQIAALRELIALMSSRVR